MLEPTVSSQLAEAASLMLVGMAVVFVFLALLIVAVNALSWLCSKLPQSNTSDDQINYSNTANSKTSPIPVHHVAAITAAFAAKNRNKSTK